MASEEELYISISPNTYKANKSSILMSQADFLGVLKRLHNLKVLAGQKQDLKKKLHKLFTSILLDINSIQNKMPTSKIPKTVKTSEKIKAKKNSSKYDDIEEELNLIQEKLRELNS